MQETVELIKHYNETAINSLKRAYETCPCSTTGSYIMVAFNALLKMESEMNETEARTAKVNRHTCIASHRSETAVT